MKRWLQCANFHVSTDAGGAEDAHGEEGCDEGCGHEQGNSSGFAKLLNSSFENSPFVQALYGQAGPHRVPHAPLVPGLPPACCGGDCLFQDPVRRWGHMGPSLPVEPGGVAPPFEPGIKWPCGRWEALFRWWGHMGPLVPVSHGRPSGVVFKELSFPSDTGCVRVPASAGMTSAFQPLAGMRSHRQRPPLRYKIASIR